MYICIIEKMGGMNKMTKFNVVVKYGEQHCSAIFRDYCDGCKYYCEAEGCTNYRTVTKALSAREVTYYDDAYWNQTALLIILKNGDVLEVLSKDLLYFELNGKVYYEYNELKEEANEVDQDKLSIFGKILEIIPSPSSHEISHIKTFLKLGMEDKLLCEAVNIAKENKDLIKPIDKFSYFNGIALAWYKEDIKTYEELIKSRK